MTTSGPARPRAPRGLGRTGAAKRSWWQPTRSSAPAASTRPSDAEVKQAASAIIAVMDGLQVQWLLDPGAVEMPATVALVIDAILARWGTPERAGVALE